MSVVHPDVVMTALGQKFVGKETLHYCYGYYDVFTCIES